MDSSSREGQFSEEASEEGEWLSEAHGGRCMACPGAQRGSSPEEKGLLGGEEGNPPAEVAWSQSSRAMTGRGGGVLPVGSQEPLQML